MVSIPALAVVWASTFHVIHLHLPTPCQAFVPSTSKRISKYASSSSPIHGDRYAPCFLGSVDGVVGSSSSDSIDELESRISAMKVLELKAELKSHGQPTSGLKKILQQRLLDFYQAKTANLEEEEESIGDIVDNEATENGSEDLEEGNEPERELITFEIGKDEREFVTYELEEEEEDFGSDTDVDTLDDQENDLLPSGLVQSKQKWKKKTFLLMQDAQKLVHSKDATVRKRGPKTARDAVRRIQRWISLSSAALGVDTENEFEAYYDDVIEEDDDNDEIDDLDPNSAMQFRAFQRSTLLRAYNILIHAIAKSGDDDAGYLAEQVLDEMQQNVSNGGPAPDEVTIASVMDAHAHSATVSTSKSGAKAAETFLFELLEKHEASDEDNDMPWSNEGSNKLRDSLIVTCDTMLNAWAREGTMESAERAQLILLRLEEYQRQREQKRMKGRSKNSRRTTTTGTKRPISYATGT